MNTWANAPDDKARRRMRMVTMQAGRPTVAPADRRMMRRTPRRQVVLIRAGPVPGGHHMPVPAIVRALDVNHDGIIDSNEIANASAELLTLDKNGDGRLTRDEYMGKRPGRQGPPPEDGNDGDGGDTGGPPDGPPPMDQ